MHVNILPSNQFVTLQIKKWFSGHIKIDVDIYTGFADIFLITQSGYNCLENQKPIPRTEVICNNSDVKSAVSYMERVDSGFYYLVINNKSNQNLNYNTYIQENFEPPMASGITGTSGLPF